MIDKSIKNVSILCVDNYIDSLEVLKLALELQGARVYGAVSAEEAVRTFVQQRPDVLIADLALGQADGIALLKAIRSLDPETPAIALTGISDPAICQRALDAGFDHYFVKPVDDDVLVQTIAQIKPAADAA